MPAATRIDLPVRLRLDDNTARLHAARIAADLLATGHYSAPRPGQPLSALIINTAQPLAAWLQNGDRTAPEAPEDLINRLGRLAHQGDPWAVKEAYEAGWAEADRHHRLTDDTCPADQLDTPVCDDCEIRGTNCHAHRTTALLDQIRAHTGAQA